MIGKSWRRFLVTNLIYIFFGPPIGGVMFILLMSAIGLVRGDHFSVPDSVPDFFWGFFRGLIFIILFSYVFGFIPAAGAGFTVGALYAFTEKVRWYVLVVAAFAGALLVYLSVGGLKRGIAAANLEWMGLWFAVCLPPTLLCAVIARRVDNDEQNSSVSPEIGQRS